MRFVQLRVYVAASYFEISDYLLVVEFLRKQKWTNYSPARLSYLINLISWALGILVSTINPRGVRSKFPYIFGCARKGELSLNLVANGTGGYGTLL